MSWKGTFIFAAVAVCVATPAFAQGTVQSVWLYTVKPDRSADFLGAIREAKEILRNAGSDRYYSLWHSLSGPNEYVRIDAYNKYADLDRGPDPKTREHAAALRDIASRVVACEEGSRRVIYETLPDLSIPLGGEFPKMIRVIQTEVKGDRVNDYSALIKSEVLTAQKKMGQKFYAVSRVRYGGPSSGFTSITGIEKWADLDGGNAIQKTSGPDAYQRFLTKLNELIVRQQMDVYALLPDSSYLPQTK